MPKLAHSRWKFYVKPTLIWLCAALVLGYGFVSLVQYGAYAASLMLAVAGGAVILATWICERRKTSKVRRILANNTFPVNLVSRPEIASAKTDAWILLRGAPRGLAVDLSNQLLWVLFDDRNIHALLPTALESAEFSSRTNVMGHRHRVFELRGRDEPAWLSRVVEADEQRFRQALDQLLLLSESEKLHLLDG